MTSEFKDSMGSKIIHKVASSPAYPFDNFKYSGTDSALMREAHNQDNHIMVGRVDGETVFDQGDWERMIETVPDVGGVLAYGDSWDPDSQEPELDLQNSERIQTAYNIAYAKGFEPVYIMPEQMENGMPHPDNSIEDYGISAAPSNVMDTEMETRFGLENIEGTSVFVASRPHAMRAARDTEERVENENYLMIGAPILDDKEDFEEMINVNEALGSIPEGLKTRMSAKKMYSEGKVEGLDDLIETYRKRRSF